MTIKSQLIHFFKHRVLKPQLNRQDRWEKMVVDIPEATHGGDDSPVRFNIPRAGIELEGDHAPLPGFPKSAPQMIGSIVNIRKSIYDLEQNPPDGKKHMDAQTLAELREFAEPTGADEIGFAAVPQEWVFQSTAIRYTQAIVLVMEMDKARMDLAPNPDTAVMVHETYNQLGQISNKIADWLRDRPMPGIPWVGWPYTLQWLKPPVWGGAASVG